MTIEEQKQFLKEKEPRFYEKINFTDTCWLWTAGQSGRGYGGYSINTIKFPAHVICWSFFNGRVPKGLNVCHSCDVKLCVNPNHLWVGTQKENIADCVSKGRFTVVRAHGVDHGRTKFTEEHVKTILVLGPLIPVKNIAKLFKVSKNAIYPILYRRNWKHIPMPTEQESVELLANYKNCVLNKFAIEGYGPKLSN